uniref:Uncharacterized protein n=1 Tax=Plectus sambesii TaxID=2011161 RepID=A0A914WFD1_9BILA
MIQLLVGLLALVAVAHPAAVDIGACVSIHRNRVLTNVQPEKTVRVDRLAKCIEACLNASITTDCTRVVFATNEGKCELFAPSQPVFFQDDKEDLVHSSDHTYASLDVECLSRVYAASRKGRNSPKPVKPKRAAAASQKNEPGTVASPPETASGPQGADGPPGSAPAFGNYGSESYTEWSDWSPCSVSCGSGQNQRTRKCINGYACKGQVIEYKPCNKGLCSQWNNWTEWNACSVTCGAGVRKRSRFCNTYYGCEGDREQLEPCNLGSCSQWQPWGPWGACSKVCGGGTATRTRACSTYGGCAGDASEVKKCNEHSCCASWSNWSSCSVTCGPPGSGVEKRERRCTVEGSGPYGYASQMETEPRPCGSYLKPCGQWQEWAPWASCTVTCGGGERLRNRTCSVQGACVEGKAVEYARCHEEQCPGYQPWSPWTLCSVTCGPNGTKRRTRVCDVAGQCQGETTKVVECNNNPCPEWTPWAPWTKCTEDCGGGWKRRSRVCNQYNLCPGDKTEKVICNDHKCPVFEEWGAWGECSALCGGGVQLRTRDCAKDVKFCQGENQSDPTCFCEGSAENSTVCNTHKCAAWTAWTKWGECNAECGGGERFRTRKCESDPQFCVGDKKNHPSCLCEGVNSETEPCGTHQCPNWSSWGQWGNCSEKCGGGAKERKRTCVTDPTFCTNPANSNTFSCVCPGLDHSNDQCNTQECPNFGKWSPWDKCSAPCGGGKRVRTRVCQGDGVVCQTDSADPACQCEGPKSEEEPCGQQSCAAWGEWGPYGACSVTCGKGQKIRERFCKNDATYCVGPKQQDATCKCEGSGKESQDCDAGECYSWAAWQEWGSCSRVCGGGSRNRARQCPKAGACPGLGKETEFCNQMPCPDWGSWGEWSSCSVSCGGGKRVRNRACPIEGGCSPGEPFGSEGCSSDKCSEWVNWMEWSQCSRTCGQGERKRTRECRQDGKSVVIGCLGRTDDLEPCFDHPCELSTFWSAWSPCTQTCGQGGVKTRQRAECLEPGCGTKTEQTPCETGPCPEWAAWGKWSTCSATCGGGSRTRERICADAAGKEVVQGCVGKKNETDPSPCNAIAC